MASRKRKTAATPGPGPGNHPAPSATQQAQRPSRWTPPLISCSIYCSGRKRQRPSLQCSRCDSAYHPECISPPGASPRQSGSTTTFVCARCHQGASQIEDKVDPEHLLTWAMCDACGRWRSLPTVKDPSTLPAQWTCAMHPSPLINCTVAEEEYSSGDEMHGVQQGGGGMHILDLPQDCLAMVLSFLEPVDLAAAELVCTTWRRTIVTCKLWRGVLIDPDGVDEVAELAPCLNTKGTECLDIATEATPEWAGALGLLLDISSLRHLHVTEISVDQVATFFDECHLPLISFSATLHDTPTETRFNIGRFSNIPTLECIVVRTTSHRLVLPAFSLKYNESDLCRLENLRVFVLMDLWDAAAERFLFLQQLHKLEVLQIGRCSLWEEPVFQSFSNLTHLKYLFLDDACTVPIVKCLRDMPSLTHLYLSECQVSPDVFEQLAALKQLESLFVSFHKDDWQQTNLVPQLASLSHLDELWWYFSENDDDAPDGGGVWSDHTELHEQLQMLQKTMMILLPRTMIRITLIEAERTFPCLADFAKAAMPAVSPYGLGFAQIC